MHGLSTLLLHATTCLWNHWRLLLLLALQWLVASLAECRPWSCMRTLARASWLLPLPEAAPFTISRGVRAQRPWSSYSCILTLNRFKLDRLESSDSLAAKEMHKAMTCTL